MFIHVRVSSLVQSSQLLFVLLGHLEEHTTHHVQPVLTGLYRACQDDEHTVLDQVHTVQMLQPYICANVLQYY